MGKKISTDNKVFKTHGQQLKILKNRGLNIYPVIQSYNILKKNNYYNLINGYSSPFLKLQDSNTENYIDGSSFMEIFSLYKFDRNISKIYLGEILKIEELIKSIISYHFSEAYGYKDYNYLNRNNFKSTTYGNKNTDINNLISKSMKNIWKFDGAQPYILHYRKKHQYVPLWVLVNSMSFGDISKFYSYMKPNDKKKIAKELSYNSKIYASDVQNFLRTLGIYRNILAHNERFYKVQKKNKNGEPFQVNFRGYSNYNMVNSSVFALTLIIKTLLTKQDFNNFYVNIMAEILDLQKNLHSINIEYILNKMGFPIEKLRNQ